jgi:hypothetical protein
MSVKASGVKDAGKRLHRHGRRAMGRIMEYAEQQARDKAPVRSRRLQQQIRHRVEDRGSKVVGVLFVTARNPQTRREYSYLVTRGTGIYGPYRTPIRPKNAKYLRFIGRDGKPVYRKQVKGQKPNPFMRESGEAAGEKAQAIIDEEMQIFNSAY